MYKVGIDARLIGQTGVGVYIRNLLEFLPKKAPSDWDIHVYHLCSDAKHLESLSKKYILRKANYKWHTISEQIKFNCDVTRDALDLMHFTYFSYPLLYKRSFISTIHDLTPLLFRTGKASTRSFFEYNLKYLAMKHVISQAVKNACKIITPTEAVRTQMIDMFGASYQSKMVSIYEGVSAKIQNAKENEKLKEKLPKKFMIYVGNFYPHKNIERLIKAYLKLSTDVSLILVGPDDYFQKRLLPLFENSNNRGKTIFYTNPSLEDLVFFYKNAEALVHPSLSEGFGLTLLEAAYFNCPIIASDIPVLREVLDSQYTMFDPYDIDDIASKIAGVLKQKTVFKYERLLERYSFETMTEQTVELYKQCLMMKDEG